MIASSSKTISETANEQAEAMKQTELGVSQISEVVQSNSATAQEASATSEELSAQDCNASSHAKSLRDSLMHLNHHVFLRTLQRSAKP